MSWVMSGRHRLPGTWWCPVCLLFLMPFGCSAWSGRSGLLSTWRGPGDPGPWRPGAGRYTPAELYTPKPLCQQQYNPLDGDSEDYHQFVPRGRTTLDDNQDDNVRLEDSVDLPEDQDEKEYIFNVLKEEGKAKEENDLPASLNLSLAPLSTMAWSESPILSSLPEDPLAKVAYFYLQREIGLSEEALWKITLEAGSVLGMTADTLRRKVHLLNQTMNLTDDEIRSILQRHPTLLHLSADQNLAPTLLFLLRALDLGRQELKNLVLGCPAVLSYRISTLKTKILFFTRLMGYSLPECRQLLLSEPRLLRCGLRTGLLPRFRFLLRDVRLPLDQLRIIVTKHPRLLLYSLQDNLVPKLIYYLVMKLEMTPAQIQKLLLTYPAWMDYHLERHMQPLTEYFISDLAFRPTEFRTLLLKFPRLVTHSLAKVKHVVAYLRFGKGLTAPQVKRVLYQAPTVLGLSTETNLAPKMAYLQSTLDLSDEELRQVVAGMPTLLILSRTDNLAPKLEYLLTCLGSGTALRQVVLKLPTLLGYSLSQRIQPRMQALLEAGVDPASITVGIPMSAAAFAMWLQRKQAKQARQTALLAPSSWRPEDPPSAGRIQHWTRPRRPAGSDG